MLDDLISLTHSSEFEDGTFQLAGVRVEQNVLTLSFDLNTGGDSEAFQSWEVECIGFLEHQISLGECDGFDLEYDDVLLWAYIYPEASLKPG